jgi:hypothetical protein
MITARVAGFCAPLGLAALMFTTPSVATADTVTFNINTKIDVDSPGPSVTGPTAVFTDVAADTVELTLSFPNSDTSLKASAWYFNFTGNLSALTIGQDSGPTAQTPGIASNSFKADGDGFFDILLGFGGGSSQVFNPGDVATFTLSGTSMNAHSFNATSYPSGSSVNNGTWNAAVHIGGFTMPKDYSVWQGDNSPNVVVTAVPLPAAVWAGMALMGVVGANQIRRGMRTASIDL